jgi:hypothetical protein
MWAAIARRLKFANVAALLALVLAMSGGALAARHYLITSTSQISPRVLSELRTPRLSPAMLKQLRGRPGAGVTSRQFTGVAGECANGGSEFTSASGTTFACNGKDASPPPPPCGVDLCKPSPEPFWPHSLPSGSTETGTWAFTATAEGQVRAPLSFPVPTSAPLAGKLGHGPVELLEPHEEDPRDAHPNCPGTVGEPKADPGFVCVYAETLEAKRVGQGTMRRSGVTLIFEAGAAGQVDEGTWAATAP